MLVGGNHLPNFPVNGENIVRRLQIHFQRCLVDHPVGSLLENDEGDAEVVAPINFSVHHEVVQLWIIQHRPVVGGDDDTHVVQAYALPPPMADVGLYSLLVDVLGDGVPCIVALGHDVGDGRHQRRQVFHSGSVRSHDAFSSFLYRCSHYTPSRRPLQPFSRSFAPQKARCGRTFCLSFSGGFVIIVDYSSMRKGALADEVFQMAYRPGGGSGYPPSRRGWLSPAGVAGTGGTGHLHSGEGRRLSGAGPGSDLAPPS